MKKRPPSPPPVDKHQLVLDSIRSGCQTWHELLVATKFDGKNLGLILLDLFVEKKVKVEYHTGERRYELL
jgi:hypothetical protein